MKSLFYLFFILISFSGCSELKKSPEQKAEEEKQMKREVQNMIAPLGAAPSQIEIQDSEELRKLQELAQNT